MIFVKVSFGWRHRLFLETMWAHSTASQLFMIQIIEIFLHKKLIHLRYFMVLTKLIFRFSIPCFTDKVLFEFKCMFKNDVNEKWVVHVQIYMCILTFELLICKLMILKSTRILILSEIYPNRTQVDEILKKERIKSHLTNRILVCWLFLIAQYSV